jgi:predicted DNA-binding protein
LLTVTLRRDRNLPEEADMTISISLPNDVERRLNALSATTGRSKSDLAAEAVGEHLADLEDCSD